MSRSPSRFLDTSGSDLSLPLKPAIYDILAAHCFGPSIAFRSWVANEEDRRCHTQYRRLLKKLFPTFSTGYAPNVVDPWADVAMHLSVKVNVERTGATCGSSA